MFGFLYIIIRLRTKNLRTSVHKSLTSFQLQLPLELVLVRCGHDDNDRLRRYIPADTFGETRDNRGLYLGSLHFIVIRGRAQ